ncbi:MAG: CaiB/BaiF CoA transferase family protein [Dehalococcoidia bacterium]
MNGNGKLPLEGIKVVDLTWVMVGPMAIRYLADWGATVVHVESATHVDTARTIQPFKDSQPGPERSGLYQNVNAGKLGLTLNLNTEHGCAVLRRLIEWADILAESYTPGITARWGFDYAHVREINPSIIMLSTCLAGQTGPNARFPGYGTMGAAFAGFIDMAGWPDRSPAGPFGAYTDYVAPKFIASALLAALDHRRRTGRSQYIDLSQAEASMHFLGPALLDYMVNGRVVTRAGNADPGAAPHGVYPCAGEDTWVAVAVTNDAQWHALCAATGHTDWLTDPQFDTFLDRRANAAGLDAELSEWTRQSSPQDVESLLQAHGIPASAVQTSADCFLDSQLQSRGHFAEAQHPDLGAIPLETSRIRMSRSVPRTPAAAAMFGQHNEQVLKDVIGMTDEEIVELTVAGALE